MLYILLSKIRLKFKVIFCRRDDYNNEFIFEKAVDGVNNYKTQNVVEESTGEAALGKLNDIPQYPIIMSILIATFMTLITPF